VDEYSYEGEAKRLRAEHKRVAAERDRYRETLESVDTYVGEILSDPGLALSTGRIQRAIIREALDG
jgi:hypothetical protein